MVRHPVPGRAVRLAAAAAVLSALPASVLLVNGEVFGLLVLAAVLPVASPLAFRRNRVAFRTACTAGVVAAALVTLFAMFLGMVFLGWIGVLVAGWISMFGPAVAVLLTARRLARPVVRGRVATAGGWSVAGLAVATWAYVVIAPLVQTHLGPPDGYVVAIGPDGPEASRGFEVAGWVSGAVGEEVQVGTLCPPYQGHGTQLMVHFPSNTSTDDRSRLRDRLAALPGAVSVREHHSGTRTNC